MSTKASQDDEMKVNTSRWELLAPVLTVPILAIAGYLVASLHEIGYNSVYGVPIELITTSPALVLTSLPPVLLLAFLIGVNFLLVVLVQSEGFLSFWSWFNVVVTSVFLYSSLRGYFGNQSTYISMGLVIFDIIPPLISLFKHEKEFNARIEKFLPELRTQLTRTWLMTGLAIFGFVALLLLSYVGGWTDAINNRNYLIPSTHPNSVVLRVYGNTLVCAPLTNNSTIERAFFILKLDTPNLILRPREFSRSLIAPPIQKVDFK